MKEEGRKKGMEKRRKRRWDKRYERGRYGSQQKKIQANYDKNSRI